MDNGLRAASGRVFRPRDGRLPVRTIPIDCDKISFKPAPHSGHKLRVPGPALPIIGCPGVSALKACACGTGARFVRWHRYLQVN